MSDDALYAATFHLPVDRCIFGIQESRSGEEYSAPAWLELEIDEVPVRMSRGAVRFMSLIGTHSPLITVEIRKNLSKVPSRDFDLIGSGRYLTFSGDATFLTIDGPHASFSLRPYSEYELNVWRKGGDTARERHEELMGTVYPIEGLEEYLIQFTER
ncbi:hypothetical protein [Streptomyces sp. NPDC090022]|uniref:hypothetical protein n=1 Tax=Streptomyces sp. NPDC090022 TaxID=3365920 RepID=UPI003811998B